MKARGKVPAFRSEAQERVFLGNARQRGVGRLVEGEAVAFMPNLKPSTQSISLRLPEQVHLDRIKAAANARDVPYQSLIKVWLEEKLSV